jgi:hypothetical protein
MAEENKVDRGDFSKSSGPDLLPEVSQEEFELLLHNVLENYSGYLLRSFYEVRFQTIRAAKKRRTLYWSVRLFLELRPRYIELARQVPGFWQFAVGFLNPISEGNRFGVIALARAKTEFQEPIFLKPLRVRGESFPVVVRNIEITEHAFPTGHPSGGTSTCWAKSRKSSSNPIQGILTAQHVVGSQIGANVIVGNSNEKVIDVAPSCIDAALVSSSQPSFTTSMNTVAAVAPWSNVEFTGAASRTLTTTVTATTDQLGILQSPEFPVRVILAHPGRPGDSGALVIDQNTGHGVGLYVAKAIDAANRPCGIAQHLEQVVQIMDMEVYK